MTRRVRLGLQGRFTKHEQVGNNAESTIMQTPHGGTLRRKTLRTLATGCLTTSFRIPWPGAQPDTLARPEWACALQPTDSGLGTFPWRILQAGDHRCYCAVARYVMAV